MNIPADLHIHTECSLDGHESGISMCRGAIENNVQTVALTDHCEIDEFFEEGYDKIVDKSFKDSNECKKIFSKELEVLSGVEIGQPLFDRNLAEKILKKYNFDFVLASIHHPHGRKPDIKEVEYDKIDVYAFMEDYFAELEEIANWDGCDALAHITCPMRRIKGYFKIDFDYSRISNSLDSLLTAIIQNGKALEVNTSGLRQPIALTMPEKEIIQRYKKLGGKYITIGSDAHISKDIGAGVKETIELVKECGFEEITIFKSREKHLVKI